MNTRTPSGLAARVVETAPNGVLVMAPDGRIQLTNPALDEMFGHPAGSLVGQPLSILVPERSRDAHPQLQARYLRDPVRMTMSPTREVEGRRADGSTFPVDVLLAPLRDDSGSVMALVRDLTEQKRLEEAQRDLENEHHRRQRLETVGTLVAGIAHDFNNLLVPILTFTEFLGDHVDSPEGRELLDGLESSAAQARELCAQILGFARKTKPEFRTTDMARVVHRSVGFLAVTSPSRLTIQPRVAEAGTQVFGDASRLAQVVMNLGTNAVQAIGDATGTVVVSAGPAESLIPRGRPEVVLAVEDDGPGIPPEVRPRVFEPFFSAKGDQGTGLGLSVVSRIVSLHQGRIEVIPRGRRGVRFEIVLPRGGEAPAEPVPATARAAKGTRVLVVDDDDAVLASIRMILEAADYEVRTTANAEEALALLRAAPPELVISDYDMSGMARDALVRGLARFDPPPRLLLCTGTGRTPEEIAEEEVPPRWEMLRKPFGPDELRAAVGRLLSS